MHSDSVGPLCLRLEFDCACLTPQVIPTEITVDCFKHSFFGKSFILQPSLTLFHIWRGAPLDVAIPESWYLHAD